MESNLLSCKAQHSSQGDNSNEVDTEDNLAIDVGIVESNTDWCSKQQDIDPRIEDGRLELVLDSIRLVFQDLALVRGSLLRLVVILWRLILAPFEGIESMPRLIL